jgi:hypothetical protein
MACVGDAKQQGSDSAPNMITAAFRTRLEKLLEVRSGLSIPAKVAQSGK